ncbi:trichohyalin-like [Centruroides sculpturatus]|uniref:trichohyalin-like n=1 Tax=Centruroides sculpturatus TaxID=218467 RepID=UPI000C6D75FB|nr:trichohyalin-like [Centruroides sculpturatus]
MMLSESNCPAFNILSHHSCSDSTIQNSEKDSSQISTLSQPSTSSRPIPMSRLDQKRLQWEKERAEMQEWNPWGKPGAGAPRNRHSASQGLSKTESQVLVVHSTSNSSYPTPCRSSLSSPFHMYKSPNDTPQGSQSPNLTTISQSLMKTFRNSLSFSQNNIDEQEGRKEQWIQEIGGEKHIIEENKHFLPRSLDISSMDDQKTINTHNSTNQYIEDHINPNEERIFLRGQGLHVHPDDAAIIQERRQKALDCQREVKQQIEEKRQKEREQRERKLLEEQEEEKRLEEERALMQKEYEEEQRRLKEKEEQEERKRKLLIAAMEEAQASAEAAKRASKAQRSQKSSSEICLRSSEDSVFNIDKALSENEESKITKLSPQKTIYSKQNDNVTNSCSEKFREFSVQTTDTSETHGYIENRILTPTVVRMREKAKNKNREFGTQTDFAYVNQWIADDGDSALSTSSSLLSIGPSRKNRIQHNKPTKASQKNYEYLQQPVKWGVPPQQKPFVKMSERDPHYPKRKKLLELRRQHWEREMANQKTLSQSRSIFPQPYKSRNAKITSSDGSLSSSETEEKYHYNNSQHVSKLVRKNRQENYNSADDIIVRSGDKETNKGFYSDSPTESKLPGRLTQSTDNLLTQFSESWPIRTHSRNFSYLDGRSHHPSMRKKWHSQETFMPRSPIFMPHLCSSPPVPAVQKRIGYKYSSGDSYHAPRRKWSDQESYKLESIPSSSIKRNSLINGNENGVGDEKPDGDPLVHPEIVTRRPTPRQDKILMQLSSLRQGLLLKQQELENLLLHPTSESS